MSESPPLAGHAPGPVGIGGWLILVAIGLILQPLRVLAAMADNLKALSGDTWRALMIPSSPHYRPLWGPLVIAETLLNVAFLVAAVVLLVLFFQKRRSFPRVAVWIIFANVVFAILELVALGVVVFGGPPDPKAAWGALDGLAIGLVSAAIWIPYLLCSRRVAATFVH